VAEVIKSSSNASVGKIAEHEEIGSEKEKDEEKPTGVDFSIEEKAQSENGAPFQKEEERGFDEHSEIVSGAMISGSSIYRSFFDSFAASGTECSGPRYDYLSFRNILGQSTSLGLSKTKSRQLALTAES
jgi:hypothetical protein